jgi:hypothetical protein
MSLSPMKIDTVFSINKENWQEKKNMLKQKFPHLSDYDLDYEEGKIKELIDELHSKIGKLIGKSKN